MLAANQLTRAYGADFVLRDLDLQLTAGMRLGVIGPNGAGKTTLLELLAGVDEPSGGTVTRVGGVTVGYARQDVTGIRGQRVLDAVLEAARDILDAEREMRELEHRIAAPEVDGGEQQVLLRRYGALQDRFANAAGYSIEARARKVLAGLGFSGARMSAEITTLSGGWMMRVALARLLLRTPDVLLLDEPTNHLDFAAADWLTSYIARYTGVVVAVSHDRWFLDEIATHILELDGTGGHRFGVGTWSTWAAERDAERARLAAASATQARQIAETEAFIERFRAKATKAKQVQSRVKALERVERIEVPRVTRSRLRLTLPQPPRSGRDVVSLDGVAKAYGDVEVFSDVDLVIERGRKVAVLGPNGAGKSTLLRLVAALEAADSGTCRLGHNVVATYFAQHHADTLDAGRTVLAELEAVLHDRTTNPRSVLGAFGFPGDTVDKLVGQCSGGERARLALARLVVGPANLLCLDEPTNHLDLTSRELLTTALAAYQGTVLLVTHDRALVRAVADDICAVGDGRVTLTDGDLEAYLAAQQTSGRAGAAGGAGGAGTDGNHGGAGPRPGDRVSGAGASAVASSGGAVASAGDALGSAGDALGSGEGAVVSGGRAVGSGEGAVGSGGRSVGSGEGVVGSGEGAVGSGEGAVVSGGRAVGSGEGVVGSGEGAVVSGGRAVGSGEGAVGSAADAVGSDHRRVDRREQRRAAADVRRRTQGLRTELARAEADLERAERRLAEVEAALADPTTYEDPEAGRELTLEHAVVTDRVAAAERRWESLVEQVAAATRNA